jgi:predicted TIM-barrel fold metal-dependent hydrolase
MTADRLVDVHHHALPPEYLSQCRAEILGPAVDLEHVLEWTPESSLEQMDANGVRRAYLSVSAPGVWFGDAEQTRGLALSCNDYLADLKHARPERFGFFATLPMPDVDATIAEIARAGDDLEADGVCFMTSYDDRSLGDPSFAPVFEELNRRQAVAFVHPVVPPSCRELVAGVPASLAEFAFDTTRAILGLLFNGVFAGCSDLRFVFSHGGGAVAMLLNRIETFPKLRPAAARAVPRGVMHELSRQFYDVASIGHPASLAALRIAPGAEQLLLGTDYPYRPMALALQTLADADPSSDELTAIETTNASRLWAGI